GELLDWYGVDDRRGESRRIEQNNRLQRLDARMLRASFVSNQNAPPAACRNFLHIGDSLVEDPVMRGNDNDWHFLVNQRDGAMFQLSRRIALSMDIANLLQLQRALQRQRIIRVSPEIEHMAHGRKMARNLADLPVQLQRKTRK